METECSCGVSRREFLQTSFGGLIAAIVASRLDGSALAQDGRGRRRAKSCIVLWMDGGPSHIDTFDPKPGAPTGGPFKALPTAVDGIRISEHLPNLARQMRHLAVIRSMTSNEGSHWRAKYQAHTGYRPEESLTVQHPSLGSIVYSELGNEDGAVPGFVSIGGNSFGAGFLGSRFNPFVIQNPAKAPDELGLGKIDPDRLDRRSRLLKAQNRRFAEGRRSEEIEKHGNTYERAVRMIRSDELRRSLDISLEEEAVRRKYGGSRFGQGCLLARKLVEIGVPFVEVVLPGWDTHSQNFPRTLNLSRTLDPAYAALIGDLSSRGLLDETLVLWMGEFGRTPNVNQAGGRDHYPKAWSAVVAGGGVRGGQVIGATDREGVEITETPVPVHDLFASILYAFGIDYTRTNATREGRKIPIVQKGAKVVPKLF